MTGARGFDCHGPWLKKYIPLITSPRSPSVDWLPKSIYTCVCIYIYNISIHSIYTLYVNIYTQYTLSLSLYIYIYLYTCMCTLYTCRDPFPFRSSLTDVYCKGRMSTEGVPLRRIFCSKKAPKRDLSRHHRRLTMGIRLCIAWKPGIFAAIQSKTANKKHKLQIDSVGNCIAMMLPGVMKRGWSYGKPWRLCHGRQLAAQRLCP